MASCSSFGRSCAAASCKVNDNDRLDHQALSTRGPSKTLLKLTCQVQALMTCLPPVCVIGLRRLAVEGLFVPIRTKCVPNARVQ